MNRRARKGAYAAMPVGLSRGNQRNPAILRLGTLTMKRLNYAKFKFGVPRQSQRDRPNGSRPHEERKRLRRDACSLRVLCALLVNPVF